jgi:hypothetical protein
MNAQTAVVDQDGRVRCPGMGGPQGGVASGRIGVRSRVAGSRWAVVRAAGRARTPRVRRPLGRLRSGPPRRPGQWLSVRWRATLRRPSGRFPLGVGRASPLASRRTGGARRRVRRLARRRSTPGSPSWRRPLAARWWRWLQCGASIVARVTPRPGLPRLDEPVSLRIGLAHPAPGQGVARPCPGSGCGGFPTRGAVPQPSRYVQSSGETGGGRTGGRRATAGAGSTKSGWRG